MAIDPQNSARSDIVSTNDRKLARALAAALARRKATVPAKEREDRTELACADISLPIRKSLVDPQAQDPNGYERLIGKSDLMSINFLTRGRRAADAVCRIRLPMNGGMAWATGFLVGPRLLMTNNHVLASTAEAARAQAEFGFEHDYDGVIKQPVAFNLDPGDIFFTSTELDITLVAITPLATNATPLERYGWLALLPLSGKSVDGEWVSIIQHPEGEPKQIAIHSSQIVKLDPQAAEADISSFIHYSTDTEPGSSGSPVVNDQWQVIAIHHKAVPDPVIKDVWIANQGVRISAIFALLEERRLEDDNVSRALDRLGRGIGYPPLLKSSPTAAEPLQEQYAPFAEARWRQSDLGYDPEFLTIPVPLQPIYEPVKDSLAPLLSGESPELQYFHFSVFMNAKRRFPLMTAVNIDGSKLTRVDRKDTWRLDGRMDPKYQSDDELYVRTRALEKVYFSRGHQVRMLDPCWGERRDKATATRGMQATFHFTNAAPQVQAYNDEDWGNLEDYVLDKAQASEKRLSVLTGPIFRDDDPIYGRERKGGPWQVPLSFWKIAILQKTDDHISAAAFIVGQTEYVSALYEARVFAGLKPYTLEDMEKRHIQTTIATVEQETGLDLSSLKPFDAHGSLEATRQTRWITRLEEIVI